MTIKQRIILCLQNYPNGINDDDLSRILGMSARQQANEQCRELEKQGLVIRRKVDGRIHNFWAGELVLYTGSVSVEAHKSRKDLPKSKYWFWEGNVQSRVIIYLATLSYCIRSVADTASHQQGIDIVAEKNDKSLWITVKGYPQGTEKTNPSVQATHWFKHAVFDIVEYRERDKSVLLAVALPDYPRYHTLAQRIIWLKPAANFIYYWVKQSDEIFTE